MKGAVTWLAAADHVSIGRRFVITAFAFFGLSGVLALIIRTQLAQPGLSVVGPDLYNQLFSTHGTTMMFLFAVPVFQGLGLWFVPLQVGAKDLALPRLAAFSYFTYLFGGILLYAGLLTNTGPDVGWFAYPPLSGPEFGAGKRVDVWAQTVSLTELSGLCSATSIIVTILKHRAPGMSLDRVPLFTWAMLVTSLMVVFAMPAVMVCSTQLAFDRLIATQFFNPVESGDPLLFQHLFWFFAHPEVYFIFLPALGLVSTIVVSSSRRAAVGYLALVLSLVATGLLAFGLWVHHMFATGLPQIGQSFFTAASILIAIPTGTQIFCWIATLWTGRPRFHTPLLFVLGFVAVFMVGGLSGVMLASVPIDVQVHDTYFVVAHLHYVLIGGAVFPLLGGIVHWLPKMTGRMPSERWGRISFVLVLVGFNVAFFPQHQLGIMGMTRRVYTYTEEGFGPLNLVSTIGAYLLGVGVLAFLWLVVDCVRRGPAAGPDPWGGDSLEWWQASPPSDPYARPAPTVHGRYPLWQEGAIGRVVGLHHDEMLVTSVVEALPQHREDIRGPTLAPFVAALGAWILFVGLMFTLAALWVGGVIITVALVAWGWPRSPKEEHLAEEQP